MTTKYVWSIDEKLSFDEHSSSCFNTEVITTQGDYIGMASFCQTPFVGDTIDFFLVDELSASKAKASSIVKKRIISIFDTALVIEVTKIDLLK